MALAYYRAHFPSLGRRRNSHGQRIRRLVPPTTGGSERRAEAESVLLLDESPFCRETTASGDPSPLAKGRFLALPARSYGLSCRAAKRVELVRSPSRRRTSGNCAFRPSTTAPFRISESLIAVPRSRPERTDLSGPQGSCRGQRAATCEAQCRRRGFVEARAGERAQACRRRVDQRQFVPGNQA